MKNKVGQRVRAIPTEPYPTASTGFEPIISGLSQGSATACPEGTRGICIEDALQVSRFRPNFLLGSCAVEGAPLSRIDQEDSWRSVALESAPGIDIELEVTGPCSRCQMININQTSGVVDGRYLQTLAEYRKVGSRINFGHFLRMNPDFERQVKMSVAETIQSSANDSPEYLSAFVYEGMMVKAIL